MSCELWACFVKFSFKANYFQNSYYMEKNKNEDEFIILNTSVNTFVKFFIMKGLYPLVRLRLAFCETMKKSVISG